VGYLKLVNNIVLLVETRGSNSYNLISIEAAKYMASRYILHHFLTMGKQYLKKRYNVWCLKVRIPAKSQGIMCKTKLWKNHTPLIFFEANKKKHEEIALMF
jgi:hypothetical protein